MLITPQNTTRAQYEYATLDPRQYRHPLLLGGFGSGKTECIPLRWLYLIDWRGKHQHIKCELTIVEPTYKLVKKVLVRTLDKFFDRHGIKHTFHKTDHTYTIWYRGMTFSADIASYDNPASLTGSTRTDIIIDEYDKCNSLSDQEDIWTELLGRIRGSEFATLGVVTTPEGFRNTYTLWEEKNRDNPKFITIRAKTPDNQFLPLDYITGLYDQYDSQTVKQYINGEYVNLSNMAAYYAFKRERNLKPVAYNPDLPVYFGIDFNVNPMTVTLCHFDDVKVGCFKEYYIPNSNTQKTMELIAADFPNVAMTACPDMTGGSRKTSAEHTDLEIIKKFGHSILGQSNIAERDRINIVNNALEKGLIEIDHSLKFLIRDLEQVPTNSYGQIIQKQNDPLTHISSGLGYIAVQLLRKPKAWNVR